MGYQRPTTAAISDSWQGHKNRNPPSQEPGTDYGCGYGTHLLAPEAGTIVDSKGSASGATGRYLTIDLDDGRRVRFLHLSGFARTGGRVSRGEVVAYSGASAYGSDWGVGANVHVTLWPSHSYVFGSNGTLDFERFVGDAAAAATDTVRNEQNWLISRGYNLGPSGADGIPGAYYRAAVKAYQEHLRAWGYTGEIDGSWGAGTQAAHQAFYDHVQAQNAAAQANQPAPGVMLSWNWNGIAAMLRGTGRYSGDNTPGPKMIAAFQGFVGATQDSDFGPQTAKHAQEWLRNRWGYTGAIDGIPGDGTHAAWTRAEEANWIAFANHR